MTEQDIINCINDNTLTRIPVNDNDITSYYQVNNKIYEYYININTNIKFSGPNINLNNRSLEKYLKTILHNSEETSLICHIPTTGEYRTDTNIVNRSNVTKACISKRIFQMLGPMLFICMILLNEYSYEQFNDKDISNIEFLFCKNIMKHKLLANLVIHNNEIEKLANLYYNCTIPQDDSIIKYNVKPPARVNLYILDVLPTILTTNLVNKDAYDLFKYVKDSMRKIIANKNSNTTQLISYINNKKSNDIDINYFLDSLKNFIGSIDTKKENFKRFNENLNRFYINNTNENIRNIIIFQSIIEKVLINMDNYDLIKNNYEDIFVIEDTDLHKKTNNIISQLFNGTISDKVILPIDYYQNIEKQKLISCMYKISAYVRDIIINPIGKTTNDYSVKIDWSWINKDNDFTKFFIFYSETYYYLVEKLDSTIRNLDFIMERKYMNSNIKRCNDIILSIINNIILSFGSMITALNIDQKFIMKLKMNELPAKIDDYNSNFMEINETQNKKALSRYRFLGRQSPLTLRKTR